jgi:hypothetical protein
MIKDVVVRLDGTPADVVRLAAVDQIAGMFDSHVTGVFFNVMPLAAGIGDAGGQSAQLLETARKAGDAIETAAFEQLKRLRRPTYFRRFDVIDNEDLIGSALPLARAADTFFAFRPNGQMNEPQGLIENLLYGAGRHVLLVPPKQPIIMPFDTITVAWNGSREAARAVAESLPYLQRADKVGVLVVEESEHPTEADALWATMPCSISGIMASTPSSAAALPLRTRLQKH